MKASKHMETFLYVFNVMFVFFLRDFNSNSLKYVHIKAVLIIVAISSLFAMQ